jgi:aminobenzoyl-glutamate transport protein
MFVVSQFVAVYRKTNIGMVITAWLANLLEKISFSGIPLIVITLIFIAIANLFLTSTASKWMIFSPVVVPLFMQSNISPQFAQIVMRAGDSMTKGFTPLLASFVIYIGYLNIYNLKKNRPYTIRESLKLITPYCLLISATWIILVVLWYIIGLPIGPGVSPTI